jgi:phosphoglycolate phosphatase
MSRKLAVFDVDGTLVDSRLRIHAAASRAFEAAGRPRPDYEAVRQIVGLGLVEALGILAPDLEPDDLARLVDGYRLAFQTLHRTEGPEPLYPGAAGTLARLKEDGWTVSMATGKSRRGVEMVIAAHGWAELFASTHCNDDGPGKPDPAMLTAAMSATGASPERTLMIGDTAHDMRMARAAGVRALGVGWGFHTLDEVRAGGADWVGESFAELDAELARWAARL